MIASFWTSSSVKVWTADRFERSADGNAVGLDVVVMVVDDVSGYIDQFCRYKILSRPNTFVLSTADITFEDSLAISG